MLREFISKMVLNKTKKEKKKKTFSRELAEMEYQLSGLSGSSPLARAKDSKCIR
jgi:hypothetical protein